MQQSVTSVRPAKSLSGSHSEKSISLTSSNDSDGHDHSLPADIAAWKKQVREKTQELLVIYESMSYHSDKELSGFAFYTADELRYHLRRIEKITGVSA